MNDPILLLSELEQLLLESRPNRSRTRALRLVDEIREGVWQETEHRLHGDNIGI